MFQRMSDAPAEACEVCGAGPVEKILFPVAVHFQGSGFYNTDYGKSRKSASDSDGGSSSESTSDSKSETKSDTKSGEKSSGESGSSSKSDPGSSGSSGSAGSGSSDSD
jgi:predicted nucleic acid-binding Zn ribbon protein